MSRQNETVSTNSGVPTVPTAIDKIIALCVKDYDTTVKKQPSTFEHDLKAYIAEIDLALVDEPAKRKKFRLQLLRVLHPDKHTQHHEQYNAYTIRHNKEFDSKCCQHLSYWSTSIARILSETSTNEAPIILQNDEQMDETLTRDRWEWRDTLVSGEITSLNLLSMLLNNVLPMLPDDAVPMLPKQTQELLKNELKEKLAKFHALRDSLYHHPNAPLLNKIVHDANKDIQGYNYLLYCYNIPRVLTTFGVDFSLSLARSYADAIKMRCMQFLSFFIDLALFHQDIATDRLKNEQKWVDEQKKDLNFANLNEFDDPSDLFYVKRTNHVMINETLRSQAKEMKDNLPDVLLKWLMNNPSHFKYSAFEGSVIQRGYYDSLKKTLYHQTTDSKYNSIHLPVSLDVGYASVKSIEDLQALQQTFNNNIDSPYYAYYVTVKDNPTNLYYFSRHTYNYPTMLNDSLAPMMSDVYFTFNISDKDALQSLTDRLQVNEPLTVQDILALETLTNCPEIQDKKPIELLAKMRNELTALGGYGNSGLSEEEYRQHFYSGIPTSNQIITNQYLTDILNIRQCEQYYLNENSFANKFRQNALTMNTWLCFFLLGLRTVQSLAKSLINNPIQGFAQAIVVLPFFLIYTAAFFAAEILTLLEFIALHAFELVDAAVYSLAAAPIQMTRAVMSFFNQKKDPSGEDIPPSQEVSMEEAPSVL